ncbi:hypothetical protein [Actinokineospora inagensis]|uniref:hypothetical protein n=1 Tax=Actinokineospora inagensis TaxID=103730 RepID=UPI000416DF06|nr:hypothetical protein [Actinokineospora inagensis]
MTGQDIYDNFRDGRGGGRLVEAADLVREVAGEYDEWANDMRLLTRAMEEIWEGDASGAASRGAGPLAVEHELAQPPLTSVQDLTMRQVGSFESARSAVQPIPALPAQPDFWPSVLGGDKDSYEAKIRAHYEANANNVAVMQSYEDASMYNASSLPTSFGNISIDEAKVALEPGAHQRPEQADVPQVVVHDRPARRPDQRIPDRPVSVPARQPVRGPQAESKPESIDEPGTTSAPHNAETRPSIHEPVSVNSPVVIQQTGAQGSTLDAPTTASGPGNGIPTQLPARPMPIGQAPVGPFDTLGAEPDRPAIPPKPVESVVERSRGFGPEGASRPSPAETARRQTYPVAPSGVGKRRGEDEVERVAPAYLVEGDPEGVFGSDEVTAPSVIGLGE